MEATKIKPGPKPKLSVALREAIRHEPCLPADGRGIVKAIAAKYGAHSSVIYKVFSGTYQR